MLYVGLDLSRKRLDWRAAGPGGVEVAAGAAPPDREGLASLAAGLLELDRQVVGVVESMNGARFVHDELERAGWEVRIADAQRAKALAPLTCRTDRIDAGVLCELAWRDLVPEIWLPGPACRAARERARFRLALVRHRTSLKNRIHAALIAFGHPPRERDLFGRSGRGRLARLALPEPWQTDVLACLELIDHLERQLAALERELIILGATDPDVSLLVSAPGVGPVLGYTIAAEIGDIGRFSSPTKLVGYTGLCPRVHQSGERDRRGPLAKNGPRFLRWALIEAAQHAARTRHYRDLYQRTRRRLGRQRGPAVAAVCVARRLAEAIWWMLTRRRPFAPIGAALPLTA